MRKVVVNTTPIIALADIGYLVLLKQLYGKIIIPEAVDREIISEPRGVYPGSKAVNGEPD